MAQSEIRYIDTRGKVVEPQRFSDVVIKGLAPGGGLFVPAEIPHLTMDEILGLAKLPYARRASFVYQRFGVDFTPEKLDALFDRIYGKQFDTPEICPIICPISDVADGMHVLELWHGPTSAFKDMALQALPVFFSASVEKQRAEGGPDTHYLIAVATSGDTGKAALQGFADVDHTSIVVYYPRDGVSDIQRKQMVTQEGKNVCVYAVEGNFDDCQTSVKRMFADADFAKKLLADHNTALSSANSINWGRLLPQVVYYVSAYTMMAERGAVKAGDPIDITVPTGNFGNIMAAWYAKQMGVPIARTVCASNDNKVLTDFINSGIYTIREREFLKTPSPSMDILVSSNLERLLFEVTGHDGETVRAWEAALDSAREYQVDAETLAKIQQDFGAGYVPSDECLATIREVYETYGYLIDPHTAVAWKVAEQAKGGNPMLVVSTANWAKFGANVYRGLEGLEPGAALPEELSKLTDVELNRQVSKIAGDAPIPAGLDELDQKEVRFTEAISGDVEAIESSVVRFL